MFKFQKQRTNARKNRCDVISFDNVPDHIVDAFFGSCTYKNRLIVATFGFLNGVDVEQSIAMTHWKDTRNDERMKMIALYKDFEKPRYMENYYSYNVHRKLVMFLNGDIRKFGKRIPGTTSNWIKIKL